MDYLLSVDRTVFLWINHLPHVFGADWLALFLSGIGAGGVIWVLIGMWVFVREERKDHHFFLPIISTIGVTWILVEGVLKYLIARPRPTLTMGAIIVGDGAGWFSFPSSHAAIAFAMAVVLSRYEPRFRTALFVLATMIALSRVYLGVHYPFDVIAGAAIGYVFGTVMLRMPFPHFRKTAKAKRRTRT